MSPDRPIPRYLGVVVLLAMTAFAAVGFLTIRKDVEALQKISQDNFLWSATQVEVAMLRFELSVARMALDQTEQSLAEVQERFDILWNRIDVMSAGRVGEMMRVYDEETGTIADIKAHLQDIDMVVQNIRPDDTVGATDILQSIESFRSPLRFLTLRVVRGDTLMSNQIRDRIQKSSQITSVISLGAVLLSVLSLLLIFRENKRQRQIAEFNRKAAREADAANKAKSRFLTMMSHELRNPLNGVIGPLALLEKADLDEGQKSLLEQASRSGRSIGAMVSGLLDFGEMQDGRFRLAYAPFRVTALVDSVREFLAGQGAEVLEVRIRPGVPEMISGDMERLTQVCVHLLQFVLETRDPTTITLDFDYERGCLVGEIGFAEPEAETERRLDLLMGLGDVAPDQVASEALRPLISRELVSAAGGRIELVPAEPGGRAIRFSVPASKIEVPKIAVHIVTRSAALAAIYEAALRSERVVFHRGGDEAADFVLVDATSVGLDVLMETLKRRHKDAVFISIGRPSSPAFFNEVVETPNDMGRLRSCILDRLAS